MRKNKKLEFCYRPISSRQCLYKKEIKKLTWLTLWNIQFRHRGKSVKTLMISKITSNFQRAQAICSNWASLMSIPILMCLLISSKLTKEWSYYMNTKKEVVKLPNISSRHWCSYFLKRIPDNCIDFYKIIIFDHYSAGGFGFASSSGGKLGSGCSFLSLHSWRIDSGYLG
jgi:hypothetical protein